MTTKNELAMSIAEAAGLIGVSKSTLYALAKRSELPGTRRIGSRIVVHRQVFNEWLSEGSGF
jgi:excisionase family DNA binding protein